MIRPWSMVCIPSLVPVWMIETSCDSLFSRIWVRLMWSMIAARPWPMHKPIPTDK